MNVFKANEQSLVSPPVIDSRVLLKQTSGGATGCSSLERPFKGNWLCGRWVMSLNVAIGWSVIRRILQVSSSTFERLNTLAEHDLFNLPLHLTLNHLNSQIVVKSLNLNIQLMIIIQVAADQFLKKKLRGRIFRPPTPPSVCRRHKKSRPASGAAKEEPPASVALAFTAG